MIVGILTIILFETEFNVKTYQKSACIVAYSDLDQLKSQFQNTMSDIR